jgi:sterol desaturase/sphingolipid hydroxylase (fatty acid hydroxylase superfamily)
MHAMWSTTFERFPTGKTPIVGAITVSVYDWTRPQPGESRMFEQDTLERLACGHPRVPLLLYTPFGLALVALALARGMSWPTAVAAYAGGVLAWSAFEYAMHRFSFHHTPKTPGQVAFVYLTHGVHHAYPDDSRRWVMPMIVTMPVGLALLGVVWLAAGDYALPGFAGFTHGYLAYDTLHYLIHRGPLPTAVGRFLRRHHLQHHYATPHARFGVSSPVWDVLLRTPR